MAASIRPHNKARMGRFSEMRHRASFCILFLTSVGALPAAPVPAQSGLPTRQEINGVLHELSEITGFEVKKQLPFVLISRQEINQYVQDEIKRSVKPDDLRAEELTLKKFGFAPADFDLKKATIDLLTEQAAAFYDYHRRKLYISDWATVSMREPALIHELAHALADQNFPIGRFLGKSNLTNEESMAREAVVEGQASWLMLEVDARRSGRTLADADTARQVLGTTSTAQDSDFPVFNKVPLYLQKTMLFPYEEGQKFQQAVFKKDGKPAFSQVFRHPPVSSSQIQHPDRYFAGVAPTMPDLPKPAAHFKAFVKGSLGETETRVLLEQYIGQGVAEDLGPQLKGSQYRVDEGRGIEHRTTLVYVSEWRDEESAVRFFEAYQKVLRGKWQHVEVSSGSGDRFAGKSDDGYFRVVRSGVRVLSEEGFANPPA